VIGFSIAAPVGPIGVLCIRRTLADGRVTGLAVGLEAAAAGAVYGVIAGFGLTAVSSLLVRQQGAPCASSEGCSSAISAFAPSGAPRRSRGARGWHGAPRRIRSDISGSRCVLLGSALWWLMLRGAVSALRARLDLGALRCVNRLSGLVLLAFGVTALARR
jgi:threonine/homoserine/homoserine lactone efflux protein